MIHRKETRHATKPFVFHQSTGYIELTQYIGLCTSGDNDKSKQNDIIVIFDIGWETKRVKRLDNVLNWIEHWPSGFWRGLHDIIAIVTCW